MSAHDLAAVACTLEFSEMVPRLARWRLLAETSLVLQQQIGNTLSLSFRLEVESEVKALIELERQCCRFLEFQVEEAASSINVTVTAPNGIGESANWLFAQFLPAQAAAEATLRPCCPKCN